MKIQYLEIVTPDVEGICGQHEATHGVTFGEPDQLLGGAKTAQLHDGSIIGVRPPLRENEAPITRPYWLVSDIGEAVAKLEEQGAEIAVPPLEIPGKGTFAIYVSGGVDHGLWQL